jgi:short-subunit dehydrogenase
VSKGVAVVTGASSGIGAEFARALARRGHELVIVARRRDRLEQLAQELGSAHVVECDLAAEPQSLVRAVAELGLTVDLLVNNAGFGTWGRFAELDPEKEAEQVRLNCEAVVVLTRAFVPGMVERGRGGIINVASTAGMQPLPYEAVYAATKAFVRSFTAALRVELRGTGVNVLNVDPGPVDTEWQAVAGYRNPDETMGVPGKIGPDQVVEEALRAFDRGRGSIVPGAVIRWFLRLNAPAPTALKLRVVERMYRPRR